MNYLTRRSEDWREGANAGTSRDSPPSTDSRRLASIDQAFRAPLRMLRPLQGILPDDLELAF
jgi:hypothetical protein